MSRPLRTIVVLVTVATVALGMTGCQTARIGARCRTTDFGQTATQILQCKRGRWRILMTKAQYVQLLIAIRNNTTTTTAPTTTTPPPPATAAPTTTTVPASSSAYEIAGGYLHSCAIVAGQVRCVGHNNFGQLGNGTTDDSVSWVSTGLTNAVSVSAGTNTSCAVKADATAWCWGLGDGGRLGNGAFGDSSTPVQVPGISDATQVSSGASGTCLRTSEGLAKCWGEIAVRGDGGTLVATTPVTASITGVRKVAVGTQAACALKSDETVWCWGQNADGQLGDSTTTPSLLPVQVSGVAGAIDIGMGGTAACAVILGGTVKCWGNDEYFQTGDGDAFSTDHPTPITVGSVTDAAAVALNFYSTCVIKANATVACWGQAGYLGDGTNTTSATPVLASGITNAYRIAATGQTTCVLLDTYGASCWGSNGYGEAGSGNTDPGTTPLTVVGMP